MGSASHRIRSLLRARLAAGPRGGFPASALLSQIFLCGTFCALVRDALPPFAYGLVALTASGALVCIPLLGELGWLLRADEAGEWVESLPVRRLELKLARTLHLLLVLAFLTLGALVPAALLAPSGTELVGRLALPLLGIGLATFIAAFLLLLQGLLGGRAEGLLVLAQTAVVVGVVVGLVVGLRYVPTLARLPHLGETGADYLGFYPPAWFAAPLAAVEGGAARWWLPVSAFAASLVVLVLTPAPRALARSRGGWLEFLLAPARALATRVWVRRDERAPFDLVYDVLPREREVVLRSYPMIGIPLAFLLIAATGDRTFEAREDLLALLLFTAGVYLPILLTHVPASASHTARWLLDCAPTAPGAIVAGTIKALTVRFLLPLYLILGVLAWFQAGPAFALRMTPAGFLASLFVVHRLYPVLVTDPPLSVAPDAIRTDLDWLGLLGGMAFGLTLLAILASRVLDTPLEAAGLTGVLLVLVGLAQRGTRGLDGEGRGAVGG